jgi:hypothetical protein
MKAFKFLKIRSQNFFILIFILFFLIGFQFLADNKVCAESFNKEFNPRHYEIRWFFKGTLPEDVKKWFSTEPSFGEYIKKEKRSDIYFSTKDAAHISPKLREDRLEIKYLNSKTSFSICESGVSGIAENWPKEKWAFSKNLEGDVRAAFMVADLGGSRTEVFKVRWQRKFEITEQGKLVPVPMENRPQRVCLIELTDLEVKGEPWWTVAYEAISFSELPLTLSQEKLCELFKNYPGPKLTKENSYAYPQWLSTRILN